MDKNRADAKRRNLKIARQSINPFGKNFSNEVQSDINKRKVPGYKTGDHFHHNRIVEVLTPFFGEDERENLAMVDHFYQKGAYAGNNDKNLTSTPSADHIEKGGIHQFAIENNIQAHQKGFQNSGSGFEDIKKLDKQISALPFKERMEAASIFLDYIQPALDDEMRAKGYNLPKQEEVANEWRQLVDQEHNEIVLQKRVDNELSKIDKLPRTGQRRAGAAVDILLNIIRE